MFWGQDGSLFVNFPYCRNRIGLLSSSAIPANGSQETEVNLESGGKIASHLAKYSHHRDGRAHFSQDGKIFTAIKRQSVALDIQSGHIFSLYIQGLNALDQVDESKDLVPSPKRALVNFEVKPSEAVKIVGRWYDVTSLDIHTSEDTVGPAIPTTDGDGVWRNGRLISSPHPNETHVLVLTCHEIGSFGTPAEVFQFCGGFDPPEIMTDPTKEAGFLMFTYPVVGAEELRKRVGSVDYIRKASGLWGRMKVHLSESSALTKNGPALFTKPDPATRLRRG